VAVRAGARRYQDEPVAADAKLPGIAVDALLGQREWRARERAEAGDLWQAHALVFTTSVGTAYESHNLRRDFRRVTAAAGLGVRWVPKELRTSFVSMMSYQGVPVEEIARLLRPVITTGAEVMDHCCRGFSTYGVSPQSPQASPDTTRSSRSHAPERPRQCRSPT
jgi:hypothetical protein